MAVIFHPRPHYYRRPFGADVHGIDKAQVVDDRWTVSCLCGDAWSVDYRADLPDGFDALDAHLLDVAHAKADAEWAESVQQHNAEVAALYPTDQERWHAATVAVRRLGVAFRTNVQKCCRGCIEAKDLGMADFDTRPYAFTYGGQGGAVAWDDNGRAVYRDALRRSRRNYYVRGVDGVETVWINHGEPDDMADGVAASAVVRAFRDAGLNATWNGEPFECVRVDFATTNALVPVTR